MPRVTKAMLQEEVKTLKAENKALNIGIKSLRAHQVTLEWQAKIEHVKCDCLDAEVTEKNNTLKRLLDLLELQAGGKQAPQHEIKEVAAE